MSFRACTASIAYLCLALSSVALSGATPVAVQEPRPVAIAAAATAEPAAAPEQAGVLTGVASWYGKHWQGRKTASGTRFDIRKLTAANRDLPLNTRVRVTNLLNGLSVVVLVNDRGPYVGERVMDLSEAAAKRLGMIKTGLAPVRIETIATQAA